MATKAITFKKSQYGQRWTTAGEFDATIAEVNRGVKKNAVTGEKEPLLDKQGHRIWFFNFNLKNHKGRTVQIGFSETDKATMPLAIFTSQAFDACGINWSEEDLSKTFDEIAELWDTKGLIGKDVKIKVRKELGDKDGVEFTRVEFL